jgi:hypothetical protein
MALRHQSRGRRRTPRPVDRPGGSALRGVDMTAGTIRHMFPFFDAESRCLWVAISALLDKGRVPRAGFGTTRNICRL